MTKLSVRERATRAVVQQIFTVKESDGFAFTVKHVDRNRANPQRAEDPPQVWLFPGRTNIIQDVDRGTANFRDVRLPITIVFATDLIGRSQDEVYNLFVSDLKRALKPVRSVIDTTAPGPGREVFVFYRGDSPIYSPIQPTQVLGQLFYEIQWREKRSDPRYWDDDDEAAGGYDAEWPSENVP